MKDRLALFVPSLRGGGAERVMVNLARGFADRGLEIDLVLAKAEGPYLSEIPPSVRLIDLKAPRVLASLPGLVRYLHREKPKALLSAMDHANVVALWARWLAGVPTRVVVSVHNTPSLTAANAKNLRARLMPLWVRPFYRWADAVVAVSQGVAEDLISLTGLSRKKVCVIYNPVVTPELLSKAEEPLNHHWFAPGEPPVVLGVGRLTAQKDFHTLIRAFALVRRECRARLMILGEGEERPGLESLLRELRLEQDAALLGFVQNPYKYMKRAAVFVLSSRWEGFGNVLVEALAVGTPVVATDCPNGPAEILENGRWGYLVPVGNPEALAEAVLAVLKGKSVTPVDRTLAFSVERVLQQYAQVLGLTNGR